MGNDEAIQEFIQLREQKAEDWRFITQVNLSMLAATAAILAAAISTKSSPAFVVAPIRCFSASFT